MSPRNRGSLCSLDIAKDATKNMLCMQLWKKQLQFVHGSVMLLSLTACGNGKANTTKAFENSKEAFRAITNAYLATNECSQDIYEAWRLGVNDRKSYDNDEELSDFASEMHFYPRIPALHSPCRRLW